MRFTDIFIHRPVLATVVSLLILLLGARAAMEMEIRQYPELESTTGPVSQLANVVNQVGLKVRPALNAGELPRSEEVVFLGSYPQGPAAASFFPGLAELRRGASVLDLVQKEKGAS